MEQPQRTGRTGPSSTTANLLAMQEAIHLITLIIAGQPLIRRSWHKVVKIKLKGL